MLDDEQRIDAGAVEAFAGFENAAPADPGWVWRSPLLRPGLVVHEPGFEIDGLLAEFALTLRSRGFRVAGLVQTGPRGGGGTGAGCDDGIELFDLAASKRGALCRAEATARMRAAILGDADLVVFGRLPARLDVIESAAAALRPGPQRTLPMLSAIPGGCIAKWLEREAPPGAMLAADLAALWAWWGPENLYRDLAAGVTDGEVRRIVCGERWVLVEGPQGAGLGRLPAASSGRRAAEAASRGLLALARGVVSWDPFEAALGFAAVNAHYNRYDLAAAPGNGARALTRGEGRVVVVGAFPGVKEMFRDVVTVETTPRPGEHPPALLDTLIGASRAVVVNASALARRTLPGILRQAQGRPLALIGPETPMTPRLGGYGVASAGGLVVTDPAGLARAIGAGAQTREFTRFGRYAHLNGLAARIRQPTM